MLLADPQYGFPDALPSIFREHCQGCDPGHTLGAPKIGDHAAWAERYKAGKDQMLKLAISGIRAMPPRGGSTFNDQQMKDAIAYMLHESGIDVTK